MRRITPVKYLTTDKPNNPDKQAIVTLLESIGYKVYGTEMFFGCDYIHVLLKFNPKYTNCVKRKVESRLPLRFGSGYRQRVKRDGVEFEVTRCAVSIDRSRSVDGINDLLSTFKVQV